MKKTFSILLAALLCCCTLIPAFAADSINAVVTISDGSASPALACAEVTVTDKLTGLRTGRAVAEAVDNVVKAALKQDQHVAAGHAFHLLGGDIDSAKLLLAHTVGKADLLLLLKLKAVNRLLIAAAGRSSGRNIALAEQLVVLGVAEDVHAETADDLALRGDFSVDVLGH